MAISLTNIGTNYTATATTTLTGVSVPVQALIVLGVQEVENVALSSASASDGTNGSYTLAANAYGGGHADAGLWYFQNSAALSSATITYTHQGSTAGACISAFYATGIAVSGALDAAVTATSHGSSGTSGAPTVTSGTPATAGELFVAVLATTGTSGETFTQDTGHAWATPPVALQGTGGACMVYGGSYVNTGSSALTYNPAAPVNDNYGLLIVGFKAAVAVVMTATAFQDSAPAFGTSALIKVLSPGPLADSAPSFGTATLVKVLAPAGLADSAPTLGASALIEVLATAGLADSAPTLAAGAFNQKDVLSYAGFADSAPSLAAGAFNQADVLAALPLTDSPPTVPSFLLQGGLNLDSYIQDYGLSVFALANKIAICSQVPLSYADVTTYGLGSIDLGVGGAFGTFSGSADGTQISSTAFVNGVVSAGGTPACWAVVDDVNSRLLATGPMSAATAVVAGYAFGLSSMTIDVPGH